MSFDEVPCFVPVCDSCGPDWWDDTIEWSPHFVNAGVARKQLAAQHGWRITDHPDGQAQMLCSACAPRDDCARLGHQWKPADIDPLSDSPPRVAPLALCDHCHRVRYEDTPPPGHPDSMTAELCDADEEYLARLDAELSPEEAI